MFYVYPGRFQPLTKYHEEDLLWLANHINNDDKIIIGIIRYETKIVQTDEDFNRFKPQFNPLTYWQRIEQIKQFIESNNLNDKIYEIVPLPRPSTDMKKANCFLPTQNSRKMCFNRGTEYVIKEQMFEQGENIYDIESDDFDTETRISSSELIFSLISLKNDKWKNFVSEFVYNYLINRIDIEKTVNRLWRSGADGPIETIHSLIGRTYRGDEKKMLEDLYNNLNVDVSTTVVSEIFYERGTVVSLIGKIYDDYLNKLDAEKVNLESFLKDSIENSFTAERYRVRIRCYKVIIDCCTNQKLKDSTNTASKVSKTEFESIKIEIEKKIELMGRILDTCRDDFLHLRDGDKTTLESIETKFNQSIKKLINNE